MSSQKTVGDYSAANSIDGSTNYLLIQPGNSSTAYNKINRNVLLGVTGQPMDISSSQNVTNKTLDNTNTVTLKDTLFTLQDDGDATKQARFQLSGITTATTRTYTLPNASSTIADIATSQTFTNKTLTAPVINNGSITGTTITTDAIVGQSASTSGTVYGLAITSSKISGTSITNATIGTGALATNAVQANQLATNAITLGYAQSTSSFLLSASQQTQTLVTSLSVTVTIPAGGRRIKITVYTQAMSCATASDFYDLQLWDGTVGVGTVLQKAVGTTTAAGFEPVCMVYSATPAAGSKTYNVSVANDTAARNVTVNSSATGPAFILVEAI